MSSEKTETKKNRRGVNNQTQAVTQLRFHEKDAAPNGLFIAELSDVKVDWSINAEAKTFTGIKVPRLTFEFTSTHAKAAEKRHAYYTLFPVESNVNTIPGGTDEWKVNQVLNGIKHLLDVFYLKGRLMTEEEEDMLALNFSDIDDEGNYVPVDPQEVANAYGVLFNNVANIFAGRTLVNEGETPKPIYKDKDGKFIRCWIKLIRAKKIKGDWKNVGNNGELSFDPFINNGFVELQNGNNPPTILRLELSKESITPKEVKKTPNIPGMGGVMIGDTVPGGMPSDMSAYAAAQDDMPF